MPPIAHAHRIRSLADDLRARTDIELATLLRLRTDIAEPVPENLAELASRTSSVPSVRTALDGLDRRSLLVLEVLAMAPQPVTPGELAEAATDSEAVLQIVSDLWSMGLLWGARPTSLHDSIHVVTAAIQSVSDEPPRPVDLSAAILVSDPIASPAQLDLMAGQHALIALSTVTTLGDEWATRAPASLKSGGLGVRELGQVASLLQVDDVSVAFWLELAMAAGLVGPGDGEPVRFAPTFSYDSWLASDYPQQWTRLARAWLASSRDADRVGSTAPDGARLAALGNGLSVAQLPILRRVVLSVLAQIPEGEAIDAAGVDAAVQDKLPRVHGAWRSRVARTTLREAELLGVTARGALTSLGRALINGSASQAEGAARAAMPAPTEEFLAQADLTLVVPGPPSPTLRTLLGQVADVESTGGAAVYRVTPASIARILDAGRTPADVLADLTARSATPLPQPLVYMINDVARKHGGVRVGAVDSYLRCDDEAAIEALLASAKAASMGIVRIAPNVVVARVPATQMLELARELGHVPLAEAADGTVVAIPAAAHRVHDLPIREGGTAGFDDVFVEALVRALRRTEADAPDLTTPEVRSTEVVPRMATAQSAVVLRAAQLAVEAVWIGYADNAGSTTRRLIDVVAMDAGAISAYDHSTGKIRTLALSRVTGAQRATTDS